MRVFRLLGARRLRLQPLKAAIAVVAVAAGVSLAVAVLVTVTSVERSVRDFGVSLAGPAPLRIVGADERAGLTPDAIAAAEAVDGVRTVVPVVQAVSLADPADTRSEPVDVLVLGVDCRAAALFGEQACDDATFTAAGDGVVAIGPSVAAGLGDLDGATVRSEAGRIPLDGVPVLDDLAGLAGGRVVLQSTAGAQHRFLQGDRYDVAYVLPRPGVDLAALHVALQDAVGEQNAVLDRDDPPPAIGTILYAFLPLFSLLAMFGLGIGAVLVRNTLVLSIEERRRQLAVLGALGARGRTIVGGLLGEAAILGLVGGALGTFGGELLAGPIVTALSDVTLSIAGIPLERHVSPTTIAIGLAVGAIVAAATAVMPARRALRVDAAAELSGRSRVDEATTPRLVRRLAVAAAALSVAIAACWVSGWGGGLEPWQARIGPLGMLGVSIATLIASAALAPLLLQWAARPARRSRRPGIVLGLAGLVRDPRRVGALVVAVSAPIVVAFTADGVARSARASIAHQLGVNGDGVSVSTTGPGEVGDAFLGDDARAALAALPGVARVESGAFLVVGSSADDLVAVKALDAPPVFTNDVLEGSVDRARFDAGEVLIGAGLARDQGVRSGDEVRLATPTGFVDLPVQAVWEDGDYGAHTVLVPYDTLIEHWGPQPAAYVYLRPTPGTTEAQLAATVRAAADEIDPRLQVRTSGELADDIGDSVEEQMVPFRVLQRGLLLVAFVAVLSTLLLAGYQRRREHGLLAAVGATPADVGRAVVVEAGIVGATAIAIAALSGPTVLWSLLQVMPLVIGFRDPFHATWGSLATAGCTAVVVAILAALWPAWRAGRVEVLDALRYE